MWDSTDINKRGEELLEYLVNTKLDILNVENIPTFRDARRAVVIDITQCSRD